MDAWGNWVAIAALLLAGATTYWQLWRAGSVEALPPIAAKVYLKPVTREPRGRVVQLVMPLTFRVTGARAKAVTRLRAILWEKDRKVLVLLAAFCIPEGQFHLDTDIRDTQAPLFVPRTIYPGEDLVLNVVFISGLLDEGYVLPAGDYRVTIDMPTGSRRAIGITEFLFPVDEPVEVGHAKTYLDAWNPQIGGPIQGLPDQ